MTNIDFPKELSLEFAATLIPKRATLGLYGSNGQGSQDELYLGGHLDGSTDNLNASGILGDDRSHGSNGSTSDLLEGLTGGLGASGSQSRPPLTRASTSMSMPRLGRQNSMLLGAIGGNSSSALLTPLEESKTPSKKVLTTSAPTPSSKSKPAAKTTRFGGADSVDSFDDFDFDDDGNSRMSGAQKELKNIDFFRVCSLCELRLPRASVDIKVLRKHVVKLR